MRQIVSTLVLFLAVMLAGAGCGGNESGGGAAAPAVPVVAVEAKRQPVVESLPLVGTLVANEEVELKSEIDGQVEAILFEEGDPVEQGDLLVRLDASKLEAEVAEAEANYQLSQANLERNQQLADRDLISPQEFDQVKATFSSNEATLRLRQRRLKDTRIYAPFDGVTGVRQISPGQVISKNTIIGTLINLDPLKVEVNVPERFLSQLEIGQTIELGLAAFPDQTFEGEVYFIGPKVDPDLRTALVRARIPNPERKLKPGMFANLELTLQRREDAVVIPQTALMPQAETVNVYIVDAESKAQLRKVEVGLRMGGDVEILSGLKAGEQVIVEGHQKTRPGGEVQVMSDSTETPGSQGGDDQSVAQSAE